MKTENNQRIIIVLDTSAFIAGFDPFSISEEQFTVPKVEEEIRKNSIVKMRFESAIENGKVKLKAPAPEYSAKSVTIANIVGDSFKLSETDKQLLALTLELKDSGYNPQLVTDDYSIQNVATKIKVEVISLATLGIKRQLQWIRYCPGCHKEYSAATKFKECQFCGTMLKRKPIRAKKTN